MNLPLLTTHSHYSFGLGVPFIHELCAAAETYGYRTMGLTDVNGIYGMVWFLEACENHHLSPIVGAELRHHERAVLLVHNRQGYSNLCSLLTSRHLDESFSLPNALQNRREGLVVLTDSFSLLQDLAGSNGTEDLFVEIRPGSNRSAMLRFSRESGIPAVASNDVYFIKPEDHTLHKLLTAIHNNTSLSRLPQDQLVSPDAWLKTPQEWQGEYLGFEHVLENSIKVAEKCISFRPKLGTLIFPTFEKKPGERGADLLREMSYAGAQKRYGEVNERVRSRMEHELNLIISKGFADFFLVVREIVQQSPRTCGRGSVAASLVSYCLGITDVDPIAHNLYFERFLNPGRVDPPDADIDFAWDERDDILQWIFNKHGEEHAAMISNHVTLKTRAAVREIAKVYGMPEQEISRVTKKLSGWGSDRISDIVKKHPVYKHDDFPAPWPEIFSYAERLQGTPRNLSVHPGGVVIALEGLDHHVPRQRSAKGVNVIHFEKDQAEDYGLVKIDVLGNRSLAVVRDGLQALKERHGVEIEYQHWNPIDDSATRDLIRAGKSMGCFYIESPAMRLLLQKARSGDYETLVVLSSLVRPASNKYINMYVDRLHGQPYQPLHPLLENVLHETFGVMVYQEDVSKTAMALADFDTVEADMLRKVLTKKHAHKKLADFKEKFFSGCRKKNISEATTQRIWEMILSFSGYSFCKPHSASYAMLSFKCAWLKAHHPAIFMAAVISNQGGFYSTQAYLGECRRLGLRILPPDINVSEWKYAGDADWVRVGLMQLKGVKEESIKSLLEERRGNGPFESFADFLRRVRMDPLDVRVLIKAGVFDSLEPDIPRPGLIWLYRYWAGAHQPTEFDHWFDSQREKAAAFKNYNRGVALRHELDSLGVLVSTSPLELFKNEIAATKRIHAADLPRSVGKSVQVVGWFVTGKLVQTNQEELMEFFTFEDETGLIETVFFPKTYRDFCHLMLDRDRPFLLRGVVQNDRGAITLNVNHVRHVEGETVRASKVAL